MILALNLNKRLGNAEEVYSALNNIPHTGHGVIYGLASCCRNIGLIYQVSSSHDIKAAAKWYVSKIRQIRQLQTDLVVQGMDGSIEKRRIYKKCQDDGYEDDEYGFLARFHIIFLMN